MYWFSYWPTTAYQEIPCSSTTCMFDKKKSSKKMRNRFSICKTVNLQIIRQSREKMKVNVFPRESISITVLLRMYRRIFSALPTFWPIFISLRGKFYQRSETMGKENKKFWALCNVASCAMKMKRERPLNSEGRKEKVRDTWVDLLSYTSTTSQKKNFILLC